MEAGFRNLIDVTRHFADESVCKKHLETLRWNGKPVCPHCNHDKVYRTSAGFKCANPKCYKKFTVLVGTFFENTKIPLSKWFVAIYIATSHKKGISSLQLSKDITVTQKTAWFMLQRIREMLNTHAPNMLAGDIEIDETFVGGKEGNKHANKKIKNARGTIGKQPVMGAIERSAGEIKVQVIKSTNTEDIHKFVTANIKEGSTIYTDQHSGYDKLTKYNREFVNHSNGEYVRGDVHTNTMEGFWSLFKRGIIGIYHQVSVKHLNKYCSEFSFRYNTRWMKEAQRFDKSISGCKGRLKYKVLIAN